MTANKNQATTRCLLSAPPEDSRFRFLPDDLLCAFGVPSPALSADSFDARCFPVLAGLSSVLLSEPVLRGVVRAVPPAGGVARDGDAVAAGLARTGRSEAGESEDADDFALALDIR